MADRTQLLNDLVAAASDCRDSQIVAVIALLKEMAKTAKQKKQKED